jgi:hypothetical protein
LVAKRRGASSMGCLFRLLIVAAVIYFGVNVGGAYWRFYQFQDDMRQIVAFAPHTSNEAVIAKLRASADSLNLPPEAGQISIRRNETMLGIEADYDEHIELPMYARDVHFHPHAEGPL